MIDPDPLLESQLKNLLGQTELSIEQQSISQLVVYVDLLHKWNKTYNLTAIKDRQQMLTIHIADSLVVSPYLKHNRYIDVGTGAGLPGIPLAIYHPNKQFVLLDALGKRIRFLKQVVYELGLKNVTLVQSRVEVYQPDKHFDGILSRGFASLKDMLHWCQHLVDCTGEFLALKGQLNDAELSQIPSGFTVRHNIPLQVPELIGKRHLVIFSKT
jgi:16S rRNA (guanine527-N7)-methyltransferase